jgi:Phosphotransferase enzyme family
VSRVNQTSPPSAAVIGAFGGDPAGLEPLAGGQGGSWLAGTVVLKRAGADSAAPWLGPVLLNVPEQPGFRLARPLAARDGTWVAEGWEATAWLPGRHQQRRWPEALAVSGALHRALAAAVPARPPRANRAGSAWGTGDRVAWGEEEPGPLPRPVAAVLDRLAPLLAEPAAAAAQLIHGDLGLGNILFDDEAGLAPAVLDVSPYWRPAAYASAVLVADAVAFEGAPVALAATFLRRRDQAAQALARAVVFRVVTAARNWESTPGRVMAELEAYRGVLALLAA